MKTAKKLGSDTASNSIRNALKIRIAIGKTIVMGPGKADLLEAIQETGSISSAAKHMKMSYRRAWELVDVMNKSFTQPLVISSPGGVNGGGAQVSEFGHAVLKNYRDLVQKSSAAAQAELQQILANIQS